MCYCNRPRRFGVLAVMFFCLLSVRNVAATPAPLTLPSNLKGVQYFPRGHAWWSMLYDWYTVDGCTTTLPGGNCVQNGETVSQVVQNDLTTLATNGTNLIHLYLWDQDFVTYTSPINIPSGCQKPLVSKNCTEPGFVGWDDGGPTISPGNSNHSTCTPGLNCNQWSALQAFVSAAKAKGIWVVLHFAIDRVTVEMNNGAPSGATCAGLAPNTNALATCLGGQYAAWINTFISALEGYQDVLIWGIEYGIQGPSSTTGLYPSFWQAAYPPILTQLQSYSYSSPSGRALTMLESGFGGTQPPCPVPGVPAPDVQPIVSLVNWTYPGSPKPGGPISCLGTGYNWYTATGYQWNWREAPDPPNAVGTNTPSVLDLVGYWREQTPYSIQPDMWAFQMYNASAADLEAALECVAGVANSVCSSPTLAIPFSKMFVSEVATGSSFASSPIGNGLATNFDAQTPTTTAAGQAQWLTDTLCVFQRHGIPAFGWYSLYDSASWWEANFNQSGGALSGDSYWGLSSEVSTYGNKQAWTAFLGYPSNCPSGTLPLSLSWHHTPTRATTHKVTAVISTTLQQM